MEQQKIIVNNIEYDVLLRRVPEKGAKPNGRNRGTISKNGPNEKTRKTRNKKVTNAEKSKRK